MEATGLLPPGVRLLVAVSGGPDSTALLLSLRLLGRNLVAAHFDHRLREGSSRDADWTEALCGDLGVPIIQGRRDRALPSGSLQAVARQLRYEFLAGARAEAGAGLVVVAHTADDLVEGLLLHLLRGTGIGGLRGMPDRHGAVVRPMLRTWRGEITAFLDARDIHSRIDPSNSDRHYARARVRLELLPALEAARPGTTRRLHAVALRAATWHSEVEARAATLIEPGTRSVQIESLAGSPQPVRAEVLRRLYQAAGGPAPGLSRRHLRAADAMLNHRGAPRTLSLPGGLSLSSAYGEVSIGTASTATPARPAFRIATRDCSACATPGAVHLRAGPELTVGFRRPGLRMRPLGARGTRKLQDILVDARVPRAERDRLPLVFADGNLAWVPGVAVSQDFVVTAADAAVHVSLELGSADPPAAFGGEPKGA
ncbi:MAG: tRNA lysidine(34) synthetase TilS [Candidatus Dormibacteraceae bacterium]